MPHLSYLRRHFLELSPRVGCHRQIGLRRVKDALDLGNRNPVRVEELVAQAEQHLELARAVNRHLFR